MVAARRAAVFAAELGFQHVIFEGNAKGVIKALSMRDFALTPASHLVKEFRHITGSLRTFSLFDTRRQGNNVAHALAMRAMCSFPLQVWMEDVLPNILYYVIEDFPI